MRNINASPSQTPSQHSSTLTISPFVSSRSARAPAQRQQWQQPRRSSLYAPLQQQQQQQQRQDGYNTGNSNNTANLSHRGRVDAYQSIVSSPLGQKTNQDIPLLSLATPSHQPRLSNFPPFAPSSRTKVGSFGFPLPPSAHKSGPATGTATNSTALVVPGVSIALKNDYQTRTPAQGTKSTKSKNIGNNNNNNNSNGNTAATLATGNDNTTGAEIDISELSSIERLRLWRHDALMQHMYGTAEYIGDKVYTITEDPNDAFWLAQVYYDRGSYLRAINLLTRDNLETVSVMCRYLVGLCMFQLQRYEDALDIVGRENPFGSPSLDALSSAGISMDDSIEKQLQGDGGIKIESSLCFLRGKIYAALFNMADAKEAFKEAVLLDVKNFEAFEELTSRKLLTPGEEWNLLDSLDFSVLGDNADMIRHLYTLRCSNLVDKERLQISQRHLIDEYILEDNIDIVHNQLDTLFTRCKFNECLDVAERYLERDELNPKILPIYVSCLHELGAKNKLFVLAHSLVEKIPKDAITWYTVATYYLTISKTFEARKFFTRATVLDPGFIGAWLGFVHTYSLEGEQDQAITAYSTAIRFFPGNHLPHLFLAMQYMTSHYYSLAEEYFKLAYDICPEDPLLLNEMGVMYFKNGNYEKAKRFLNKAMEQIKDLSSVSRTSISIQMNLAHTYRKLGDNERAIKCFRYILEDSEDDPNIYVNLGFLYLKTNQLEKAIDCLHKALQLRPNDAVTEELLVHALELNVVMTLDEDHPLLVNSRAQDLVDGIASLSENRQDEEPPSSDIQPRNAGKKRASLAMFSQNNLSKRVRKNNVEKQFTASISSDGGTTTDKNNELDSGNVSETADDGVMELED